MHNAASSTRSDAATLQIKMRMQEGLSLLVCNTNQCSDIMARLVLLSARVVTTIRGMPDFDWVTVGGESGSKCLSIAIDIFALLSAEKGKLSIRDFVSQKKMLHYSAPEIFIRFQIYICIHKRLYVLQ